MLTDHVDKGRAAGSGHLLAFMQSLQPFLRLRHGGHVAAETDFIAVVKAQLLQGCFPAGVGDICAELSLGCRGQHGDNPLSGLDHLDNVHHKGLGADGAEGAAVDAVSALDALFLINHADAVLIIGNGVHGADLLAGSLQMGDGVVGAGLRAQTALLALGRVDIGAALGHADGAELAGILAGLSHTFAAVVRYRVRRDGTLLAGRVDNLHHII